jgi:hypothetical protein
MSLIQPIKFLKIKNLMIFSILIGVAFLFNLPLLVADVFAGNRRHSRKRQRER